MSSRTSCCNLATQWSCGRRLKITTHALFVVATATALAAGATQASAQAGGATAEANGRQKLDVTLSSTQGYDNDQTPDGGTTVGLGGADSTGYSTTLVGAADYTRQIRRVQVRATGTSTFRYLRPLDDGLYSSSRSVSHSAGVGIFARLPKRTTAFVNQTATYSPSYLYNLFPQAPSTIPGDAPPAAPDYALNNAASQFYGTSMTIAHDFTGRSSLSASADYQNTDTSGGTLGRRAVSSYGINPRFTHRVSRNTAAMAEYVYRYSELGLGGATTTIGAMTDHGINVGVDFNRPLSATRHLIFGAHVGSSITIARQPALAVPAPAAAESPDSIAAESPVELVIEDRHYRRMSGQLVLGYDFARTWKTGFIYRRGVDNIAGLSAPISADRLTANIEGKVARRVDVLASAGYSLGESALYRERSTFETYTGDVRIRYGLTRTFAAYVEYLYYFYDSRGSTPIAPEIASSLERKGVRAGLTLLVPALRK
jgi:hypothetical protein